MAAAGELEVFRITPEIGKCYKHVEATRSVWVDGPAPNRRRFRRYFSTKEPRYVGKFVSTHQQGSGDGAHTWDFFDDNGKVNRVDYSYEGNTCFIEVSCMEPTAENRARKSNVLTELSAMPPVGIYPGGKIYHNAKASFGRNARTLRRKGRKSHRRRISRKH